MYEKHLLNLKRGIIVLVIFMMIVVIGITVVATGYHIYQDIGDRTPILEKFEILDLFGYMLLIVIGIELLDTVHGYLTESKIHVETVLLIAVTAVSRELIVTDYTMAEGAFLIGIGVVVASIALSYYLIKKVERMKAEKVDA